MRGHSSRGSSIKVNGCFAFVAASSSPEKNMTTFRAHIASLFILDPFFSSHFTPVWDCTQNDLLAHGNGKVFDKLTGKIRAFVTAGITLVFRAVLDGAFPALDKGGI